MTVLVGCSAKGSPGVTTALLALALTWPREALLVEADPAGSDLRAGFLQASVPPDHGLLGLALAVRRGAPDVAAHAVAAQDGRVWVVPGLTDPSQREAVLPVWPQLVFSVAAVGRDVLIDVGRLEPGLPLLPGAEPALVLVVLPPTLAGVDRAYPVVARLRSQERDAPGAARLGLLLVGAGPYPAGEVSAALGAPVLGVLPAEAGAARALATGRVPWRSGLLRAARTVAAGLAAATDPSAALTAAGIGTAVMAR